MRLFGCDETGKGEILGDMILCCAEINMDRCSDEIKDKIWQTDTKRRMSYAAWDETYKIIKPCITQHRIKNITPDMMPQGGTLRAMNHTYINLINMVKPQRDDRIIIDDYGINYNTKQRLKKLGCRIITEQKADDKYIEVRVASILAKRVRVHMMLDINNNQNYVINGIAPGSGNCGDVATRDWLKTWCLANRRWPPFVKTWWAPIKKLEATKRRRLGHYATQQKNMDCFME